MSVMMTVDDRAFRAAAAEYARMKNKSDADVVNRAMRYWLPFAASRVIKRTKGIRKVHSDLYKRPRNAIGSKFKRTRGAWGGTLAAGIIAARLKKRGRLSPKFTPPAVFWETVNNMVAAKANSVRHLQSGFIPAFRQFKVPNRSLRGHTRFKGRSVGQLATPSITHAVEAFARNAREGAVKITPNAFKDSLPDVTRQFIRWMEADMQRLAEKTGF
jgi:hypothetical protein